MAREAKPASHYLPKKWDADAVSRVRAARKSGDRDYLLEAAASERDVMARSSAIRALGMLREARAVEHLTRIVSTTADEGTRIVSIRALSRIGDKRAVPALRQAADSGELDTRLTAMSALLDLNDRTAIERLARVVIDSETSSPPGKVNRRWIAKKLRQHHGVEAVAALRAASGKVGGRAGRRLARLAKRLDRAK